jgi:hypothetical protein
MSLAVTQACDIYQLISQYGSHSVQRPHPLMIVEAISGRAWRTTSEGVVVQAVASPLCVRADQGLAYSLVPHTVLYDLDRHGPRRCYRYLDITRCADHAAAIGVSFKIETRCKQCQKVTLYAES